MKRIYCLFLFALMIVFTTPLSALNAQDPGIPTQTSLDALFVVNSQTDTTTVYMAMSYLEQSKSLRWVFPVPQSAENIRFESNTIFDHASRVSEPFLSVLEMPCELSVLRWTATVAFPAPNQVNAINAPLLTFDAADEAWDWLTATGDAWSEADLIALQSYVAQGYRLIGMALSTPNDIPPANGYTVTGNVLRSPALVYDAPTSDALSLPLQLRLPGHATYLDSNVFTDRMPVTMYVLSDVGFSLANYTDISVDLSRIDSGYNLLELVFRLDGPPYIIPGFDGWEHYEWDYDDLVQEGMDRVGGSGFVTEFRGLEFSSSPFQTSLVEGTFSDLRAQFPYLTRMRTFVEPEQVLEDPTLLARPDASPFMMTVLGTVDPARYWGCSSYTLRDTDLELRLPPGRTSIPELRSWVAHPEGWVMTQLSDTLYGFSPVTLSRQDVRQMEMNGEGPPMLLLQRFALPYGNNLPASPYDFSVWLPDPAFDWFERGNLLQIRNSPMRNATSIYWPLKNSLPMGDLPGPFTVQGVRAVMMSSVEDWAQNGQLYNDMLRFLTQYQYYLSPDLRNTLFLGDLYNLAAIGYPESWEERWLGEDGRYIVPVEASDVSETPRIFIADRWQRDLDRVMRTEYGLSRWDQNTFNAFEAQGRRGWVFWNRDTRFGIIEVSTPAERFAEDEALLRTIVENIRIGE